MAASFPGSIRSLAVPAAGDEILYTDIADMSEEVTALLTALVNGRARASAYHNTTQSINSGTSTALNLNSEDFDAGTMHDTVTNNTRVTVPSTDAGVYLAIGGTSFAANGTGYRQVTLKKNGATDVYYTILDAVGSGNVTQFQVSHVVSLAASDYLELYATQSSGGALNVGSATRALASFLQLVRIW
jgi:hypothetical protein